MRRFIKAALCICWMSLLPRCDWPAVTCRSLHISLWRFFLEPFLKLKAPESWVAIVFRILRCHVLLPVAVIDYTSTLLWIYSRRHRLWLNDNDPDKQLKSVSATRTQQLSDSGDRVSISAGRTLSQRLQIQQLVCSTSHRPAQEVAVDVLPI